MGELGEVLGWAAAICYFVSVANFFVKRIFKAWIAKLPKDNTIRKVCQLFVKLFVKDHRYFGMGAGFFAVLHLCWQIIDVRISFSGILAAVLMTITSIMGVFIAYRKKGSITKVHRPMAIAILAVILFHMITKL